MTKETKRLAPADLEQRLNETMGTLAALDVELMGLALAVEEGDEAAKARVKDLGKDRAALVVDLERLQAAKAQADERQATEARAEAQRREAERQANIRKLVAEAEAAVAAVDAIVRDHLRPAIVAMKKTGSSLYEAVPGLGSSLADFNIRVPALIETALAVGGYDFKGMPFVGRDREGYPDISACALAPHFAGAWALKLAGVDEKDKAA